MISRFKELFKNTPSLKNIIIISTIFTFAVDIFYEFGPVYLTGLWFLTPSTIALYNAVLSITLAIGSSLPHYFSERFSVNQVIIVAMSLTVIIFGLMVLFPSPNFAFILFGLIGINIATVNVNMTVQVSNTADKAIQGEALGAQLSLRMLGDALICLLGGFLIISSVLLPIALCCLIALIALLMKTFELSTKSR